ncbi:unnamed protein product [Gordionus sp. m RMFG-2023]|uniref:uncharacterized protein LOC135924784 n=1 Tax=Gordionus sp. m RMFG-2023 TaxID=3053472 RepID=UPI0030E44058
MINWKYKEENAFSKRKSESEKILQKYPDRIPIIIEKIPYSDVPEIDRHKYLVPQDISVAQLIWIIRKRLNISSDKSMNIFANKTIPNSTVLLNELYYQHKDEDGFLYISYTAENAFG